MQECNSKSILYNYLFLKRGAYVNKCPDLLVNNKFYEYKTYEGIYDKDKLGYMLSHAVKQSNRIIIDVRGADNISTNYIYRRIMERIKNGQNIIEAWILKDGGLLEQVY
jgi:hypothetical protein